MANPAESLRLLVEKLLLHRGVRDVNCRVFPPSPQQRYYSILLERIGFREQFFLNERQVAEFVRLGNEKYVVTEVRAALRKLDRVTKRKANRRS